MTPAELDRIEKKASMERDQHEYSSLFTYSLEHPAEARRCQELDNILALLAEVRRLCALQKRAVEAIDVVLEVVPRLKVSAEGVILKRIRGEMAP